MSQTFIPFNRHLYAVPWVLLLLVAAIQVFLANAHELSQWKGGGFGMFSTVDSPGARQVRAYLVDLDGKKARIVVPGRLDHE